MRPRKWEPPSVRRRRADRIVAAGETAVVLAAMAAILWGLVMILRQ